MVKFKGGASTGYKKYVSEHGAEDDTYSENGVALFRAQGSGPENMQAIQVDTAARPLNSSIVTYYTRWRQIIYLGWEPKLINGPRAC